jgi:hypothetical protein
MTGLYIAKMRTAVGMQSRSLRAEAVESLVCDMQHFTVFIGLGANALLGWWWADPIAALLLIPFLIKEGRENLEGHEEHEGDEEDRVCFCVGCLFGLRKCTQVCCVPA